MFIGISLRNDLDISFIKDRYLRVIKIFNMVPILLNDDNIDYLIKLCDGFILPGGDKYCNTDKKIIRYSIDKDIPLLGICLGMQEICAFFDDYIDNMKKIDNHNNNEEYVHQVRINKDTLLYKIIKKKDIWVNSRHNYIVNNNDKFIIDAKTKDGIIEAVEVPNKKFILGLQWHPEDMIDYDKNQYKIFNYFINECRRFYEEN